MFSKAPKLKCVIISFVVPLFTWSLCFADEKAQESLDAKLGTGGIFAFADYMKSKLKSETFNCAYNVYAETLGIKNYSTQLDVAKDNAGLEGSFEEILHKNPCFARHTAHLLKTLKEKYFFGGSLADEYGKGKYANYRPGWVWDMAMEETGGNQELAILMLTMDHANQKGLTYTMTPAEAEIAYSDQLGFQQMVHDRLVGQIEKIRMSKPDEQQKFELQKTLEGVDKSMAQLKDGLRSKNFNLEQPLPTSVEAISIAKGLSNETDISAGLKEDIVHGYSMNSQNINDKQYHVMSAAYMGCALAKCGVNSLLIPWIERMAAWGYRSIAQCSQTREYLKMKERIETTLKRPYTEINEAVLEAPETRKSLCPDEDKVLQNNDGLCVTLKFMAEAQTQEQRRADTHMLFVTMDAAVLYKNWYVGGSPIMNIGIPCTRLRGIGPPELNQKDPLASTKFNLCNSTGMSAERCAQARKKLEEWEVDFSWTESQHYVGAKFGAEQCEGRKKSDDIEATMCARPIKQLTTSPKVPTGPAQGVN